MAELSKAIYPKSYNTGIPMGHLWSTYYVQAHKWIFVFSQSKQNITEDIRYLELRIISPGKPLNYLTGLESYFLIKHWVFCSQERNLIRTLHWGHDNTQFFLKTLKRERERAIRVSK